MVGAAIVRQLLKNGHRPESLVLRTHKELDLTNQAAVNDFFKNEKIDHIALAAAKVGGIHANNTYPADFIYTNLMIQCNIIHGAYKAGIEHLLFLGSSCIYPKHAPQPMKEEYLLTGELEPTNEPYAVAKIAGIKMCESYNRQYGTSYRSVMPTNLYGPGDNYHLENSHVIPAMIRKFHLAKLAMQGDLKAIQQDEKIYGPIPKDIKEAIGLNSQSSSLSPQSSKNARVLIWGTGKSYREFLHVDDMASACLHIMNLDQYVFTANPDTPQSSVLNPQSPNLTPQSSNPNPKSSALNPKSSNLSPKSSALPPQSSVLSPKSSSVESSALSPQSSNLTPKSSSIESSFLNIGTGHDQTIADTAQIIKKVVGFDGEVVWDTSKPDGTPRKLLNTSQINALHWKPAWSLEDGLQNAYDDYKRQLLPQ